MNPTRIFRYFTRFGNRHFGYSFNPGGYAKAYKTPMTPGAAAIPWDFTYPKERIEAALANFFTEKNLTRLREMTLSETANFLDRRQRSETEQEKQVRALGQVMVAISSLGPDLGRLLRKTARLAAQLNAQWYAVYVRTRQESAIRIDAAAQRRVSDTLDTAQKMGGLVILLKHENVAQALISFAREYGITHIVLGRPRSKAVWQFWKPALHEKILQELPNVDLIVV